MAGSAKGFETDTQEEGKSLVRTGEEAAALRRRSERPGRLGRYLLIGLGMTTAGAGAALWFTDGSLLGAALTFFGAVLLALGIVQHLLLRRDRSYWPDDALLWPQGLELVLHNGEVRGLSWSDPKLALDLVSRPAPPPTEQEFLLIWMPDSKIPAIEITSEGFEHLHTAAVDRRLVVTERRSRGRGTRTRWVEIRQGATSTFGSDTVTGGGVPSA
ncbi:MAG: hypothetical protein WB786_06840 [Thermoplasmata archaeon]